MNYCRLYVKEKFAHLMQCPAMSI